MLWINCPYSEDGVEYDSYELDIYTPVFFHAIKLRVYNHQDKNWKMQLEDFNSESKVKFSTIFSNKRHAQEDSLRIVKKFFKKEYDRFWKQFKHVS